MPFTPFLILTPEFPDEFNKQIGGIFVKEQTNYLKNYFERVYVISPTSIWRKYLFKDHSINYSWDNVQVYYPIYINFPFPYVGKHLKRLWIYLEKEAVLKMIKIENFNPDLIHAHYTLPSGAIAVKLKNECEVPVIITEHTSITLHKALKKKDPYFIQTWKKCDAIIRVNKKDITLLKKFTSV